MSLRKMKGILIAGALCALVAGMLALAGCGGQAASSSSASASGSSAASSASASADSSSAATSDASAPASAEATYTVNYGTSELYTKDDIDAAVQTVMAEFDTWKGATMNELAFTDDETCKLDVEYANSLRAEGDPEYTQAIVLTSVFHSPSGKAAEGTAWDPDKDYVDWTWHLARVDGGDWKLLTWGY